MEGSGAVPRVKHRPQMSISVPKNVDSYFLAKHLVASNLDPPLLSPPLTTTRSTRSQESRSTFRRQSIVTNVVVPTHLLHNVVGSAQFSSATSEARRKESCAPLHGREGFDAEACARGQAAAVMKAFEDEREPASQSPSASHGRWPRSRTAGIPSPDAQIAHTSGLYNHSKPSATPILTPVLGQYATADGHRTARNSITAPEKRVAQLRSPRLESPGALPLLIRKKSTVTFADAVMPPSKPQLSRKTSAFIMPMPNETHVVLGPTSSALQTPPAMHKKDHEKQSGPHVVIDEGAITTPIIKISESTDYFGAYVLDHSDETPRNFSESCAPHDSRTASVYYNMTSNRMDVAQHAASSPIVEKRLTKQPMSSIPVPNSAGRSRRPTVWHRSKSVWQNTVDTVAVGVQATTHRLQQSALDKLYANAITRRVELQRSKAFMLAFEWSVYVLLTAFVYFIFIGTPLWRGTTYWLWYCIKYKVQVAGASSVMAFLAVFYAFSPLLVFFEPDPPSSTTPMPTGGNASSILDTCLLIPCYKSELIIGPTLLAAMEIFPPSHIFVLANGNSPTPIDGTEEICAKYGVNHIWSPIGSKIVAQFVGCYAARGFKNVLLIDDDCALPLNFPIVSDQLKGNVMCIGYTIKSVGRNSSRGTLVQQAQDMEYKLSGVQRVLAGKIGSVLFPHGAISLWDREFLIKTFHQHPGFNVSEDWFFGHVARELGCRTKMCSAVFVETETPSSIFFSSGGARGGFGEMTVFKQRFTRWNFFFVNGIYYNLSYILFSWKLGRHEIFTKILCFQEIFETLFYLATPLLLPITMSVRPLFCTYLLLATIGLYFLNAAIFNEVHLRRKHERVASQVVYLYYMPYKIVLTFVNVISCYYALFKYATYFAKRHPKVIEDERAVGVVLQLEELMDGETVMSYDSSGLKESKSGLISPAPTGMSEVTADGGQRPRLGRRMTVTAIGAQTEVKMDDVVYATGAIGAPPGSSRRMTVTTIGPRLADIGSPSTVNTNRLSVAITPLYRRQSGLASPAVLTVGSHKYSIPYQPGDSGGSTKRLSMSTVGPGPFSPGLLTPGGVTFYTPRSTSAISAYPLNEDDECDPLHSPLPSTSSGSTHTSTAAPPAVESRPTINLSAGGPGLRPGPRPHAPTAPLPPTPLTVTLPLPGPSLDSDSTGDMSKTPAGKRRKSSTVMGVSKWLRRASGARRKSSWLGAGVGTNAMRGREGPSGATVNSSSGDQQHQRTLDLEAGDVLRGREDVAPELLEQLAGVQARLLRERVEVLGYSVDGAARRAVADELEGED